ncbi:glycine-rich RNA-binding protein [Salix suchowensis]|nr:glycine-rich RNA-binding protein [Salix suchowensis]
MNRNLMSVARKALTKVHNPNSPATNNKLFVAGLSWSVDERSLKDAFCSFGDVTEVRILYDKDSGRSRGFGFVSFALLGRPLRISYALERARGGPVVVPNGGR